ncbi:MAG TPA: hypothetical protein VFW78_13890 [Bacteroidia bacterium]|nr:hypothetical protein [Bacteroidia bacterium]
MLPLPFLNGIFVLITFLCLWLFYRAAGKSKNVLYLSVLWLLLQALIAMTGFYRNFEAFPPRFALAIGPMLLFILFLFTTTRGKNFLDTLDTARLTYLHAIRIPVELTLLLLFIEGAVPQIMTFEGRNFDILAGLSAPFVAYFAFIRGAMSRKALIAWNIICLMLLFNVVITAVLSAPFPFQQFAFDQPNIAVFYYPFIWLPAYIVPIVLLSHLAAIRNLINKKNS